MVKPSPEIEAIVRRTVQVGERGEFVRGLLSKSDDLLLIGSDTDEWLHGRVVAPIGEAHASELGTHESELLRVFAYEEGTVGWAAYEERRTFPSGHQSVFRSTLVFVLEEGSWKIAHQHFSAPVPNLETAGVELTRTLSDLVHSLDQTGISGRGVTGTTTLMFTDIVDSTPLSISLGEAAWHRLVSDHFQSLRDVVEAEGGSEVKTMGDGGMYAFTSGSSALRAAAVIQRSLSGDADSGLQVRVGIHTGDVVQAGEDYLGSAVAIAARVASAAHGGQILVSSPTAGMVSSTEFEFGTPINVELKGLRGTHELHPLQWS